MQIVVLKLDMYFFTCGKKRNSSNCFYVIKLQNTIQIANRIINGNKEEPKSICVSQNSGGVGLLIQGEICAVSVSLHTHTHTHTVQELQLGTRCAQKSE